MYNVISEMLEPSLGYQLIEDSFTDNFTYFSGRSSCFIVLIPVGSQEEMNFDFGYRRFVL